MFNYICWKWLVNWVNWNQSGLFLLGLESHSTTTSNLTLDKLFSFLSLSCIIYEVEVIGFFFYKCVVRNKAQGLAHLSAHKYSCNHFCYFVKFWAKNGKCESNQ